MFGIDLDGGEVSADVNHDPRDHDDLVADLNDAVARDYKLVRPIGLGEWAFKAVMTGFEPDASPRRQAVRFPHVPGDGQLPSCALP
ncbi:hypothetical protein GCM10018793_05860 [Streptomyces sulfonofaciens]|uniref:Uncharacterized protein n=1 Tax=Streptomyces sulfonofaciens TaxID=68272 RepID=A0A919FR95_9ACTN|nr:hypothetical protein [Streptomyces sulfonofaciens]GHH70955.1 hypothetical protein GCM10018793_05860 [Streptomyces sulfonofaciens]